MARLELTASSEEAIDCGLDEVWAFVTRLPDALAVFSMIHTVDELDPGARYRLTLGPYGVGRFQGTVRCEVAVHTVERREIRFESLPEAGNTDVRVAITVAEEPRGIASVITRVRAEIWASPRREIPSILPLSLVERVASGTARHGLVEGVRRAKRVIEGNGLTDGEPVPGG